ncbi:MAG: CocE/NonD family hydrolase [Acidimicrobiales bacterium]
MRRLAVVVVIGLALVGGLTACKPVAKVTARGGTGQVWIKTDPNALVALYDKAGKLVPTYTLPATGDPVLTETKRTDANGYLVMRYLKPGTGYTVRRVDDTNVQPSDPFSVLRVLQRPAQSLYDSQKLQPGFHYLMTRDGILLSYNLLLPGPIDKGPYPTVVEYSGYDPSDPGGGSLNPNMKIANALGYAAIGVNIRGSGCSGGSFELWEDAQATDGYDIIETVAAQPWVLGHRVGMVGLSYPGNAQLYAASTQPPHLAGIAAAGTYDDGFRNLLRPNGIVNSGFAKAWIKGRYDDAKPAASGWVQKRIAGGDKVCELNQKMRGQNLDYTSRIDTDPYYPTVFGLGDRFAPDHFANRIKVPVLLQVAEQDEQVGGHVTAMFDKFGTTKRKLIITNGGHAESLAVPEMIVRWKEFLDLYVAHKVPDISALKNIHPYVAQQVVGTRDQLTALGTWPTNPYAGKTYAQALAAYEAEPKVDVLFENGGATGLASGVEPGLPRPSFVKTFADYPVPTTQVQRWYFGPGGTLVPDAPTAADDADGTIDRYTSDPSARPRGSKVSGGDWAQAPVYDWRQPVDGKGLSYVTPPMVADTTMFGSASVDLWLRSSAPDTDLQVTLTEVRPDGKEVLVQSGWMRASVRKLDDARSTVLQPLVTMAKEDAAPLPAGQFSPVRVEIYPFAHVFRAGSRARLIITAPGGDRIAWTFDTLAGTQDNEVARSAGRPSSVALPIIPGVSIPTGLPACPGLRAQPCRTYSAPAS